MTLGRFFPQEEKGINEDTAVGKACGFFYTAYCNIITVYLKMTQKSAEISIMESERRIPDGMNFRLIIDKEKEEEVVATVHKRTGVIDEIEALVTGENIQRDSLAAYSEDEIRLLNIDEIECITVLDGKTFAVTGNGKQYLLRKRLYEIESGLPAEFIKINKSAIANRRAILKFITTIAGGVDVVFKCGYRDYVSRRCFADIKRRLGL